MGFIPIDVTGETALVLSRNARFLNEKFYAIFYSQFQILCFVPL